MRTANARRSGASAGQRDGGRRRGEAGVKRAARRTSGD
ncbi:conserved hypothetical protein [Burkholderia pseudomallei 668]|nr:conserved hypothetical protein [Burkholderia pseudomallei 668]